MLKFIRENGSFAFLVTGMSCIIVVIIINSVIDKHEAYKVTYGSEVYHTKNSSMTPGGCVRMKDLGVTVCGNYKFEKE